MSKKGQAAVEKKNKALEKLEIVYARLDQIKPNEYNPNRQSDNDFDLLLRSITEDGFTQPIVAVRTADDDPNKGEYPFTIVDGEHRWRAASELGYEEVPLAVVPMTLEQARIATLRHNRARGSEDIELATEVLRDLEKLGALDWAQDSLALSDDELNRLLEDIPAPEALAAEVFNEAWEPQPLTETNDSNASRISAEGGTEHANLTPAAVEATRQFERKMEQAHTDEEREQAKKERQVFRLSLTFTDDEAVLVKNHLGETPAIKLLEILSSLPEPA